MTWREFKAKVETEGVRDSDEIEFIDVSSGMGPIYELSIIIEESSDGLRRVEIV